MKLIREPILDNKIYDQLIKCHWFDGFSESQLKPIIQSCQFSRFNKDDVFFNEGDKFQFCVLLETGCAQGFRITYDGSEKVFGLFHPDYLIAVAAVFMPHQRCPITLKASTSGKALLIPAQTLREFCLQNPSMMMQLLGHFSQKLYEHINQIDWLTSSSAAERLAAYLIQEVERQKTVKLTIPLSRTQLATKLGIRSETLSRLFAEWKKKQLINYQRNKVTLLELTQLSKLANHAKRQF